MIAVFRRRYYELLLYALLNCSIGSCTQLLLVSLQLLYKTLLLGKLFMVLVNSQKHLQVPAQSKTRTA